MKPKPPMCFLWPSAQLCPWVWVKCTTGQPTQQVLWLVHTWPCWGSRWNSPNLSFLIWKILTAASHLSGLLGGLKETMIASSEHIVLKTWKQSYGRFFADHFNMIARSGYPKITLHFFKLNYNSWLLRAFVAVCGLSLVGFREQGLLSKGGARASHCCGFSCCRARALELSSCGTWA